MSIALLLPNLQLHLSNLTRTDIKSFNDLRRQLNDSLNLKLSNYYSDILNEMMSINSSVHPKASKVMELIKEYNRNKVLVIVSSYTLLIQNQLESLLKMKTLVISYDNLETLTVRDEPLFIISSEDHILNNAIRAFRQNYQFGLIIEWELHLTDSSQLFLMAKEMNTQVVSLKSQIIKPRSSVKRKIDDEPFFNPLSSTLTVNTESIVQPRFPEAEDTYKRIKLFASKAVTSNPELFYILKSIYNFDLIPNSEKELISTNDFASLVVDEKTGIVIFPLSLIRIPQHLNALIRRLVLLELKYTTIYVIVYKNSQQTDGYTFRGEVIKGLVKLSITCAQYKEPEYQVSTLYAHSYMQLGSCVRVIAEESHKNSSIFNSDDWQTQFILNTKFSLNEQFLLSFPCITPLCAQLMVQCMPIEKILCTSAEEMIACMPWMPLKIILRFCEILNNQNMTTLKRESDDENLDEDFSVCYAQQNDIQAYEQDEYIEPIIKQERAYWPMPQKQPMNSFNMEPTPFNFLRQRPQGTSYNRDINDSSLIQRDEMFPHPPMYQCNAPDIYMNRTHMGNMCNLPTHDSSYSTQAQWPTSHDIPHRQPIRNYHQFGMQIAPTKPHVKEDVWHPSQVSNPYWSNYGQPNEIADKRLIYQRIPGQGNQTRLAFTRHN